MNIQSYIAKRFQHAGSGLSLDTEALAKYKDIIDLSIGDTDFTTDESIINAAFRDAKAGHTHYGDPKGDPELIDAVCRAWEEDFGQRLPRDHVLVSASSCLGMSLAMFAILDPGDEVIVFSPYFALYRAQIELAGGVCVDVPTYAEEDYAISEERLRAAITPRTKAIIFNNPTNPTGMGYDGKLLDFDVELSAEQQVEQREHHGKREQRRRGVVEDEVDERVARRRADHDVGRVAAHSSRAAQVGAENLRQDHRHRVEIQGLGQLRRHGSQEQDHRNAVDEHSQQR